MTVLEASIQFLIFEYRRNNMKKTMILKMTAIALIMALGFAAAPLFGQEAYEGEPPFVQELALRLAARGWGEEEIGNLVEAARSLQWSEVSPDTAEVVAFALHLGMREDDIDEGEEIESGLVQAQTALELALTAREMDELGYEERVVARASLTGVQGMLSTIQNWKEEGSGEKLGMLIREQVREQVLAEIKLQERVQEKRKGDARSRGPSGGIAGEGIPQGTIPGNPWGN
jgi:hypothetical protein